MNKIDNFSDYYERIQNKYSNSSLSQVREKAFQSFEELGIPTAKNEEWKYTRISSLFNKDYALGMQLKATNGTEQKYQHSKLPGHDEANVVVFVNGLYDPSLTIVRSSELSVTPLEEAANGKYADFISTNLGHSGKYQKDGVHALNAALLHGGVFIEVEQGKAVTHPLYIYHVVNAVSENILALPRTLIHVPVNAHLQIVETSTTSGASESFTNQVVEVVVEEAARLEYYKIQNDASHANQVCTTHIRQTGKSYTHVVTISLSGNIVRNNTNVVLEADHCEAHLYGLYYLHGNSHIDNHTVVDNIAPHCFSNELYKGVMNDNSTGVFNGKIYVQQAAQKTNAYQSNKNILLSDAASVNSKPQLEIFADDVKCSHGCTVGQLDEEALFYLRSRGIGEKAARSLLVQAFAEDVLENIKLEPIHDYVKNLIAQQLEFDVV